MALILFGQWVFSLETVPTKVQWDNGAGLLLCPANTGKKIAGLVLVPDEWGLSDFVKRELTYWSDYGTCVLAVDFFYDKNPSNEKEAERWKDQMDSERSQKIILGALAFLAKNSQVDAQMLGILAWGEGGARALKVIGQAENLRALVVLSAPIPQSSAELKNAKAKVLFIYPEKLSIYKTKALAEMKTSFAKANVSLEQRPLLADKSGFYDVSRLAVFDVQASQRAKALVRDFFDRFLSLRQHRKEPLK